jgi:hypothetical protein
MYAHARTYPSLSVRRGPFFLPRAAQHMRSIPALAEVARAVLAAAGAVAWTVLIFML